MARLPKYLSFHRQSGRYRWYNKLTGKRTWFGRDRVKAIERAKIANEVTQLREKQNELIAGMPIAVSHVIDMYIQNIVPGKPWKPRTRENHLSSLELYKREFGERRFLATDRVFLADWINQRCTTGDCRNKHRTRMIDLWDYAISRAWCDVNEPRAILRASMSKSLANNRRKRQRMTVAQFWAIHSYSPTWLQNAMELSLVTLLARNEIVNLQREHLRDGQLFVIREKTATHSDMAFIRIAITPQIKAIIDRCWRDDIGIGSPYLIRYRPASNRPQHLNSKPHWTYVTPNHLTKTFAAARRACGLFDDWPAERLPGFHEIRSLGVRIYQAQGYPIEYIRGLAAHSDAKTTRIYAENPGGITDAHYQAVAADLDLQKLPEL